MPKPDDEILKRIVKSVEGGEEAAKERKADEDQRRVPGTDTVGGALAVLRQDAAQLEGEMEDYDGNWDVLDPDDIESHRESCLEGLAAVKDLPPVPDDLKDIKLKCLYLRWDDPRDRAKGIGDHLEHILEAIQDAGKSEGEYVEELDTAYGWFNEF